MQDRQTKLITLCAMLILGVFLYACQRARITQTPIPSDTPPVTLVVSATANAPVNPQPNTPTHTQIFVTLTPSAYPPPVSQPSLVPTQPQYPQPPGQNITPTVKPYPLPPEQNITPSARPLATTQVTGTQAGTPQQTQAAGTTPTLTPRTAIATRSAVPQYPGPNTPAATPGYPGPFFTHTTAPRASPTSLTPQPTGTLGPSVTPLATLPVSKTPSLSPGPSGTPGTPGVIPTELPPKPPISPPPPGSSVTIWHSWNSAETAELQAIIQSFQKIYPDVTFTLQYIPYNDLYNKYEEAAYYDSGPSLLLGPAKWGPGLYDEELITNLDPYLPQNYLSSINPAAVISGKYQGGLISLPLSQRGMVMFRNNLIVQDEPITFAELNEYSHDVTHGGLVGTYLERGSMFSSAAIIGLGGELMDENGYPLFNSQYGLEWIQLLADYDAAGAVTFNTNWDLEMFRRGRTGIIIDGSWNISSLSQLIGAENLAIDPWPEYGTGHFSGWVESDSVYLNANTTGDDLFASLSFMGYLLDPNVQVRLAEVGHIPSIITAEPRDPLIQQAMKAFSFGAAYPIAAGENIIKLYQTELDRAITSVFVDGVTPADALKAASDQITTELNNQAQP